MFFLFFLSCIWKMRNESFEISNFDSSISVPCAIFEISNSSATQISDSIIFPHIMWLWSSKCECTTPSSSAITLSWNVKTWILELKLNVHCSLIQYLLTKFSVSQSNYSGETTSNHASVFQYFLCRYQFNIVEIYVCEKKLRIGRCTWWKS